MLKNMKDSQIGILIIIMILIRAINIYLPAIGLNIGFNSFIFDGWILYFLLGYFLTTDYAKKNKEYIYILGVCSAIITIVIIRFIPSFTTNIFDLSPTMIFIVSAVFMYFINRKVTHNKVIFTISKYSYSIYLIHALVLSNIVNGKLNISALTINPVIGLFLTVGITLILSIIIVLIVDNSIIRLINKLIYGLINLFNRS